ncbi:MAG: hypothetical protein K1X74_22345 [Pirellulales bacterium]|nr:hypothetical protein [Pirellulales bacterium]
MIHYTCDHCGREIDPEIEFRYVVKIEIAAALEPLSDESLEDDRDHLQELHQVFERAHSRPLGDDSAEDLTPRELRFDLCCDCQKKFARDPLAKDAASPMNFSQN